MINIDDDNLKAYCNPVIDVKYVVCEGREIDVKDVSQLKAIADLYYSNESLLSAGKPAYMNILQDSNGTKYVEITDAFVSLAGSPKDYTDKFGDISDKMINVAAFGKTISVFDIFEDTIDDILIEEMYQRVNGYAGAIEIRSERTPLSRKYSMLFFPSAEDIENRNLFTDKDGNIKDSDTHEYLLQRKDFKTFSN